MRRGLAALLVLAAVLGAGCGGPSPDLFVVERTGSVPGARLTLIVDDGGFVRCNGGARKEITSDQLITAREVARTINGDGDKPGLADRKLALPPRPGSVLRYDVRTEAGSVSFADTSTGQPKDLYRLANLTRVLAKTVCGLPR